MALQELGGVVGDWGIEQWPDADATVQPNGPQVQGNSVLTQSTVATGQDKFTGWLQGLVGNVAQYAVQKDAAKSGLRPATAANGQPVYVSGSAAPVLGPGGITTGGVLVIGAVILAVVLVAHKG